MMAMEDKLSDSKLKIPEAAENELRPAFCCPFCEKSFSNGKALGGHKRVHLLQGKNESGQIPNLGYIGTLKCSFCDQAFSSEKALHGHMRKHPDRPWRGMKPPVLMVETVKNNLVDSGQENDEMGSDDSPLNGWEITGRRSHGKAPTVEDSAQKKKKVALLGDSSSAGIKIGGGMGNPRPGLESSNRGKNKLIQKKMYICEVCNKRFKSYQALGGHKSHHGARARVSGIEEGASGTATTAAPTVVPEVPEEIRNQSTVVSFEFDLNELPPEDDDE